jgi:hypothetical protein
MTSAGGSAMRIFRKEPQQGTNADGKQDLLRHQYEQICQSYYKIEEFRGRLLALWPILGGAAGGIALLASGKLVDYLFPLGIFGFAVSVGVGIHEWTQTLRCAQLKKVARQLEKDMDLEKDQSQFRTIYDRYAINLMYAINRRNEPVKGHIIGTPIASVIVYLSVAIGWLYIAYLGLCRRSP